MIAIYRTVVFIIATAICLLIVFPFCILRPCSSKNLTVYYTMFKFFSYPMFVRLHIEGEELLFEHRPAMIVANHQHNFDVFIYSVIFRLGHIVVLGKEAIKYIPVFGLIYTLTGNIYVNRGNKKKSALALKKLGKTIREKKLSILIFPEGTRNTGKKLLSFKKGAFFTAIQTQIPILPVVSSQYINMHGLNAFKKIDVFLKVYPPIETEGSTLANMSELVKKTRVVMEAGIIEMNQRTL